MPRATARFEKVLLQEADLTPPARTEAARAYHEQKQIPEHCDAGGAHSSPLLYSLYHYRSHPHQHLPHTSFICS
jgi:hypothetical protein